MARPNPQLVAITMDVPDAFAAFSAAPVWVVGGNIQCLTSGATISSRYGAASSQNQTMNAGDTLSVAFVNLMDFIAKETTAGGGCQLVFFGVIVANKDEMIATMLGQGGA